MNNGPKIFVKPCVTSETLEISVKCDSGWCSNAEYKKIPEGEVPPWFLRISSLEAQALMDRLWSVGLRPTEGSGSAGALAATERHLADMQRLVFKDKKQ